MISKPFQYKTKIIGNTKNDNNTLNPEVVGPLNYLHNYLRDILIFL